MTQVEKLFKRLYVRSCLGTPVTAGMWRTAVRRTLAPAHSEMNINKGNGKKCVALLRLKYRWRQFLISSTTSHIQNELFQYPASLNTCFVSVRCKRYRYKLKYLEVLRITSSSDGCNHFTKKGICKRGFTHWCHCLFPQIPYISNLPQNNNTNNHLLWPWFYGPLRDLASLTTDAHSSLSTAFCRQFLTFISCRTFSTISSHLNLGLPFFYFPPVYSQIFS